jgi:hypothetical protein
VDQCDTCKRAKSVSTRPAGLLQPLQTPERIWQDIAMDFITGLPTSAGRNCILVVVDRLSKYGHFIALRHPFTAATIADTFAKEIVRLHGVPSSIVSDRDRIFMSSFWKELSRLQRSSLCISTAYHPQRMANPRYSIAVWRLTFAVFAGNNLNSGSVGYTGPSTITTRASTRLSKCLPLKLCMDVHRHP